MSDRRNNFDIFRFIAAVAVAIYHCCLLNGSADLQQLEIVVVEFPWVPSFFTVSAYLVLASLERSKSLRAYAGSRLRRIAPAYICVVLLFGFLLPATGSRVPYLLANLSTLNFLAPTLPGVFNGNVEPYVNGSLWTIKIEIMFYFALPLLVWLGSRTSPALVWIAIYFLSATYWQVCAYLQQTTGKPIFDTLAHQLPGYASYMAVGALVYYYRELFQRFVVPLLVLSAIAIFAGALHGETPLTPFVTGVLTMAFCLGPYLGPWGKYGDFSYGLYIFHYPIIQCLVAVGYAKSQPWLFLATALALALAAAVASWHLVEKRFLRRARRPTEDSAGGRQDALAGAP